MTNKVLITAGAGGIGLSVAKRFLGQGAQVAICDADAEAVDAFAHAHPEAIAECVDVTDEAAMDAFLARVGAEFGGIDVVHANAGIGGPAGTIDEIGFEDWRKTVDVSLLGTYLTCRWAAPIMREQRSGVMVLMSSTAGLFGFPYRSPYAAAKWGIIGLTKTLAMELGEFNIRVNCICPGPVEGARIDRVIANEAKARGVSDNVVRDNFVARLSMKQWISPEDIADMVEFLASDKASKVSGLAVPVDGHTEGLG